MAQRILFLLLRLALYAGLVLAALHVFQDHLLHHPDPRSLESTLTEARELRLAPWPTAQDYRGLLREPATGQARATLLLFHGNAGSAVDRAEYAERLGRHGLRVILAEYPGYGPRDGALSETELTRDGLESLRRLAMQYPGPLLLGGESLGAGVAAGVARATVHAGPRLDGLLLITPWDSLLSVARLHYPWLPVRWLLRDVYDNERNLTATQARPYPVVVVLAGKDNVIPASLGQKLHVALAEPKRLSLVAQGGHNDWLESVDEAWWAAQIAFLLERKSGL